MDERGILLRPAAREIESALLTPAVPVGVHNFIGRIEQRVIPAGPTMVDMVANMAFYYGLLESLAHQDKPPEMLLEFALARDNFYKAAKHGLSAHLQWLDGRNSGYNQIPWFAF